MHTEHKQNSIRMDDDDVSSIYFKKTTIAPELTAEELWLLHYKFTYTYLNALESSLAMCIHCTIFA